MGTNYYLIKDLTPDEAISFDVSIHLGKRSAGWQFLFDASHGLFKDSDSLAAFLQVFGGHIENEYGSWKEHDDFLKMIREHSLNKRHTGEGFGLYNDCSYSTVTFS